MTTSGTSVFMPDLADIIEEAFERAGKRLRGGYDYRTARRSIDILMQEWCNRGLNLWLVQQETITLTADTVSYILPADTIDAIEVVLRNNTGVLNEQSDLYLNRISVSDYAAIPNKLTTGARPYQYYIDRQQNAPVMYLWPLYDGSQAAVVQYWRLRRIQDTGAPASNTMDVPFRFVPALIAGLAYQLAMKFPDLMPRVEMLKAAYDEQWKLAADEDRDRSPVRFTPWVDFSVYN